MPQKTQDELKESIAYGNAVDSVSDRQMLSLMSYHHEISGLMLLLQLLEIERELLAIEKALSEVAS